MRSFYLFLLIYLLGSCFGPSSAQRNDTCTTTEFCVQVPDATSSFLQCVGLPPTDTGGGHIQRLKGVLEAMMDVYSFLKSSMKGVPLLSSIGELEFNTTADPLQNEYLVQIWLDVKIVPLLKSITKKFLTCLSTKNFTCSTYQTVVKELSEYYSDMDPVRQKWIYTFFMYPFLSGDRVAGCVSPEQSSEEWLLKNFGHFRAMARIKDLSTLNMVFSGFEVLHLLSPAQKAELLMRPEDASLDNGTLTLIFHSLLTGSATPPTTTSPGGSNNLTSPGYASTYSPSPTYNPYLPPSSGNNLREVVNGFMMAFKPIGSFVHEFVSFTKQTNMSEIRSTTLAQFLLNWTLAELADMYKPQNMSVVPDTPVFDVTNVDDWYQQVVMPLLRRFLPNNDDLMHPNIKLAFNEVFYLDNGLANDTSEIQDVCSITLDRSPCGLTNAVKNVANILHCAARTNFTISEETIMELIVKLTGYLNSLIAELSTANFNELASSFQQIFAEAESPSLTQGHLEDPNFIKFWYKIKLMPLLPNIPPDLLSCLSTKNFSCPVYQTIVAELSEQIRLMNADPEYSYNIYKYFIYSFLLQQNTSDSQCFTSANESSAWLKNNFGFFSTFAPITDFYKLNPNFAGLDVLPFLSAKQITEMLLVPLPTPPEKNVVISRVFDFLIESPDKFPDVLQSLVQLAKDVNPPCDIYKPIFEGLYKAISSLPVDMEAVIWTGINGLIDIAPEECLPKNIVCPVTSFNATSICRGINSSDLEAYIKTTTNVSCDFPLEKYACAKLEDFTADQLVSLLMCNLPGNTSHSMVLWKMLLNKLSFVLDQALDILGNMSVTTLGPSAPEVLYVIGENRVLMLTDEQLMNNSVIRQWFNIRLSKFLPFASQRFLYCLSHRNLTCQTYQQILQVFIPQFNDMTLTQQNVVLKEFILSFLSQPQSGPGCMNGSINSTEWLQNNLGPFSKLLSLREILHLNTLFNPLEALQLLTPKQSAELLVLALPTIPDEDVIIKVFDYLTALPEQRNFTEFLSYLVVFLQQGNLSCSSYKTLFERLDLAMATASPYIVSAIINSKFALSKILPPGCLIYSGECTVTVVNETGICAGVNSTTLQVQLDRGNMSGHFCNFSVEKFACASLSTLTADGLAALLKCNRSSTTSGSGPAWKLLLTKASQVLNEALDLLTNEVLDPRNSAVSMILNAIQEVRLDSFSPANFSDPAIIQLWFNLRLQPFLSSVSPEFLSCLTTKGLTCSTYQNIVQSLTLTKPQMALPTQVSVYTHFIKVFLTRNDTADPSCSLNSTSSEEWLKKNLGGFSGLVPIPELQMLYPRFSPMDALSQLTVRQLAEVAARPGQLTSAAQVNMVMSYVPNQDLPAFFDDFSPVVMGQENLYPSPVRSAMLQVVFDRVNLADVSVSDSTVSLWLQRRLRPLLYNLTPDQVTPFFRILAGRGCNIEQQGIETLNSTISSLRNDTKQQIYNSIIQTLRGPTPLRCYGNNPSLSFYSFLQRSFMGFQFPRLTTFLSLMPQNRIPQLLNSIPPSALGDYLRRPDIVDDSAELSVIYDNYSQTQLFLETEPLPVGVRQATLPIVWPKALSSTTRSEVNAWFDQSLRDYLVFLTKNLISPNVTGKASCPAFQKFVSVLNVYNVTAADFVRQDVYNSIRAYLTSATVPKCYNPSDTELNSTAWFVEYIGGFMPFLTLEDLQTFGSSQVIQVFTVNLLNIALLNQYALPVNLTNYYTELIYLQDSNFNPFLLPTVCQCVAPGPAFSQLTAQQSLIVLQNLTTVCTDLSPEISAALAGNFGNTIDQSVIVALGSESTGMSTGQLKSIRPRDLYLTLGILSSVTGWTDGQSRAIIEALLASGLLQIHSMSDLFRLGSLIRGVPPSVFSSISGYELISASQHTLFLANLMSSSQIIQETFVTQIISVSSNSEMIIQNVPDELATEINEVLLVGFSSNSTTVTTLNKKKWKRHQAEIFFDVIGVESATAELGSPNNLSSSVLQGFTCTGVRNIQKVQINKLVKTCRRKGQNRVPLVETQLTCMYNHIKGESDATSFSVYPPDMLLYYDYSLVPQASCRSYFEQLADADFSVFSPVLSYKQTALFANARSCLGITSSLTKDNIMVLGNMCCTLDGSYITNSDPLILEKLKNCPDLTDTQAAAVQTLLLSGKTQYGDKSTWNDQTLVDLGMLPLYLPSSFYDNFDRKTKQTFLKYFLRVIKSNGVSRQKRRRLKEQLRLSNAKRLKRSIVDGCTVGTITQVTISSDTFPFNYFEISQFNSCLSATTVKDNLDAITMKVDELDYLRIVLNKLQEAYGAGATIPEDQIQLLGPASRVATIEDINNWSITQIGTLSALMDPSNGQWEPSLAKAIISKYLSKAGNKLGSTELNTITGDNLCSLDIDVLKNISPQNLRYTNALNVSSCTAEKKTVLFTIASQAFITNTRAMDSVSSFQLIQSYIGGTDLNYVLGLVGSNVNMDLATFVSMPENVVMNLTVNQVKSLLGANLATLKSYENQKLVQSWIRSQYQSELDKLQIGLMGGKADPTATTSSTSTTNTSATTVSGNTLTTTSTTKGDGTRLRAEASFSLLVLFMLFITFQHIVV